MAGRPTRPQQHLIAERRQAAITMRLAGVDYLTIGRKLAADPTINSEGRPWPAGYGVERYETGQPPPPDGKLAELVKQDLHRVLKQRRGRIAEGAAELVELQSQRLDRLLAAHWQAALTDPAVLPAVLRILERQAKLHGLDSPGRMEVTGGGGGPVQLQAVTDAQRADAVASVIAYREDRAEARAALAEAEGDEGDTGENGEEPLDLEPEDTDELADGGPQ